MSDVEEAARDETESRLELGRAVTANVRRLLEKRGRAPAGDWRREDRVETWHYASLGGDAEAAAVVVLLECADVEPNKFACGAELAGEAARAARPGGFAAVVLRADTRQRENAARCALEDMFPSGEFEEAALRFFASRELDGSRLFFECAMANPRVEVVDPSELADMPVERLSEMDARDPTARHLFARPGDVLRVRWEEGGDGLQLKRVRAAAERA